MKGLSNRWMWVLAGGTAMAVGSAWFAFAKKPNGNSGPEDTGDENALVRKLEGNRHDLRQRTRNAVEPSALLAMVPELMDRAMTEDSECFGCYPAAFARFTPEDFRALFEVWPQAPSRQWLLAHTGAYLLTVKDGERVRSVMNALPEGTARNGVFHKLAKESEFYLPDQIQAMLVSLGDDECNAIGRGLAMRLKPMSMDRQRELVEGYFVVLERPELTGMLAGVYASTWAKSDTAAALKWMLRMPAAQVQAGDPELMRQLAVKGASRAVGFIGELFARGEKERASRAAEELAEHHAKTDPSACLQWCIDLPRGIASRAKVVELSYAQLMKRDPGEAAVRFAAASDPALKAIYQEVRERKKVRVQAAD